MRIFYFLLLLLSFSFANENVSIQLRWKHAFQFAGFYMAKEKGYYKKAGLNVTFKEFKKNQDVVKDVINGKSTYGISDSALIYYKLKKYPIKALFPVYEKTPLALLTINPKIKKLEDLNNKNIKIPHNTLNNLSIQAMLESKNIDSSQFIGGVNMFLKNILNKKIDIMAIYLTAQPYYFKKHHIKYRVFSPNDYRFDFYGDIVFTTNKEVNKYPDRTKRFIEASKKGWIYAMNHIDETIKIILEKYNTQNLTYDALKFEAEESKKFLSKDFSFKKNKIIEIQNLFKIIRKIPNSFEYEDFVFNPYVITDKEKKFVKTHLVKVATTAEWEPFNLILNNELDGIAVDYWELIKNKLDLKSEYNIKKTFTNVLDSIKNGEDDITISTGITENRKKYALFSKPYLTVPIVIITKHNAGFLVGIESIKNRKIALARNYTVTKLVTSKYPNLNYIFTENVRESLELVSKGKAYATIAILPVVSYKINKLHFANLKIAGETEFVFPIRIMVSKKYPELLPMINRVIDSISKEEKDRIYNKWISVNIMEGYSKKRVHIFVWVGTIIAIILISFVIILILEIKKRIKLENQLNKLAIYDRLTSIFNRYKIDISLKAQSEIAKRYKRHLSIIFFDIDHFKVVNDTYGHKMGDIVLIDIAELVSKNIRESDIFGRWGGEEFLIILPETKKEDAVLVAETLRKKIENYEFEGELKVTCSFGVTSFDTEKDSIDSVMSRVDALLYKAKESGRNRVISN